MLWDTLEYTLNTHWFGRTPQSNYPVLILLSEQDHIRIVCTNQLPRLRLI